MSVHMDMDMDMGMARESRGTWCSALTYREYALCGLRGAHTQATHTFLCGQSGHRYRSQLVADWLVVGQPPCGEVIG